MIYVICALPCEAKPLIQHFKLKANPSFSAFQVYENEAIRLLISGVGKLNAAAGVGYLGQEGASIAWLNVGIAGHRLHPLGEGFLANRIVDVSSGRHYYPGLSLFPKHPTLPLFTQDQPCKSYEKDPLYDMEASGFFCAAMRFSPVEHIHCYKVVSDNPQNPTHVIKPNLVENLITAHLEKIDTLVNLLITSINEIQKPKIDANRFLEKWHFTKTQQCRLETLLERWETLTTDKSVWCSELSNQIDAKNVLQCIERKINQQPLNFQS